ncbi:MAG: glycine zipper domain-containing protein [Flavobacteriaceae bacterium]|nr:glycine zipper domain-containing protein [Flavobacteriaceae bacterium]
MKYSKKKLSKIISIIIVFIILSSCGSTNTSQGAATGAFVGGLVDGWEGAAIGAIVGGGVGLMADSAEDKKIRQYQKEKELRLLEKSSITPDEKTAFRPPNSNNLTGSTWRVISLIDDETNAKGFASIILSFQTNTKVTTLILWKDGKSETFGETYTIVGDALIFSGKDYVTNTKYSLDGNRLVVVSPTFQAVLEEVE